MSRAAQLTAASYPVAMSRSDDHGITAFTPATQASGAAAVLRVVLTRGAQVAGQNLIERGRTIDAPTQAVLTSRMHCSRPPQGNRKAATKPANLFLWG